MRFPRLRNLLSSTTDAAGDSRGRGIEDVRAIEQEMTNSTFTPPRQLQRHRESARHPQRNVEPDELDFLGDHFF